MGNVKDLIVRILVDDNEVGNFQKAGDKATGFGNTLNKASEVSLGALTALAAGAVVVGKAASDLEQSAGGVDAVFGRYAKSMHDNANAAADAVGLSADSYNSFATVIGAQLKSAGVPMAELGGKTVDLIGKASDLAATFGGPTSDAVEAISSAMKGEMDPIEKYGMTLNQSSLQQQALSMGITSSASTWDAATKQQVVLAAITEKGGDSWGQYAKQSGTAAEKQAAMTSHVTNAAGAIGTVLLPVMAKGADMLSGWAKWAQENSGTLQVLAGVVGVVAGAVLVIAGAMKVFAVVQAIQTVAQWASNAAWLASPITWIIVAIGLLVAAAIWLYNNWDSVTKFIGDAFRNVARFLVTIGDGIASWWSGLWSGIGSFFGTIWGGLQGIVKGAWNGIIGFIENGVNGAITLINGIIRGINGVGGAIGIHLNLIPNVKIPRLYAGGITSGPTVAMIGDNPGGREAVIPLDSAKGRDLLGGNNGPTDLSDKSIDRMISGFARELRNQLRTGTAPE